MIIPPSLSINYYLYSGTVHFQLVLFLFYHHSNFILFYFSIQCNRVTTSTCLEATIKLLSGPSDSLAVVEFSFCSTYVAFSLSFPTAIKHSISIPLRDSKPFLPSPPHLLKEYVEQMYTLRSYCEKHILNTTPYRRIAIQVIKIFRMQYIRLLFK